MDYDILLAFVLATAALAISPGPDNIFVLIQSMVHGKKYGIATIAGLMTGFWGVGINKTESQCVFLYKALWSPIYVLFGP